MTEPLRIGIVCPYSISRNGGVQGQVVMLARELSKSGHNVTVAAPCDTRRIGTRGQGLGAEVTGLHPRSAPLDIGKTRFVSLGPSISVPANGSVAPLSMSLAGAMRLRALVKARAVDVWHLHEPLAPGPSYVALLTSGAKVGTFHRSGAAMSYKMFGPLGRWAAGHLEIRCAVSNEAARTAMEVVGGDYEIVGNAVDIERNAGGPVTATSVPTVLFVGRHEKRKGLAFLLRACEILQASASAPSFQLWIAGDGPEGPELKRQFASLTNVEWLGRISDQELTARMRGAHVLCAPSLFGESFGVVLAEAMAARCVVIASDIAGYNDVVGGHGVVVPPRDTNALADALTKSVEEVARGSGCASSEALDAAQAYVEKWSLKRSAERYVDLYRKAMDITSRRSASRRTIDGSSKV